MAVTMRHTPARPSTARIEPLKLSGADAPAFERCLEAALTRSLWPSSIPHEAVIASVRQRFLPGSVSHQLAAWAIRSGSRMIGTAVLERLPWDSELYRLGMARLEAIFVPSSTDDQYRAAASLLAELKRVCRRQRISHVACHAWYGDYGLAQALEQAGFRYTDTSVTLTRWNDEPSASEESTAVAPATEKDIPALQRIAATAFVNGRVDHDPRLPKPINRELYRRWIANACRGRSDVVLVFREKATVAGFICCNVEQDARDGKAAIGLVDLLATAPERQGKGIGRALLRAGLAWLHPRTTFVEIRTQLSNSVSLLLYQQEGFRMISPGIALPSGHVFHGWFGAPMRRTSERSGSRLEVQGSRRGWPPASSLQPRAKPISSRTVRSRMA